MSITIGIDLGTTNTCAAYDDGIKETIIEAASGQNTIPSVVAVNPDGTFLVGAAAAKRIVRGRRDEAPYVYSNIKRHIGLAYVDGESYDGQIDRDENGRQIYVGPNGVLYTPERLCAEILKVIKASAERRIGKRVTGAVITVPAGFDNNQIAATITAGKLAGFKDVEIKREPEAAAIAYGLDKGKFQKIVVFDLGGGTFDIVLMNAGGNLFTTIKKNGSGFLGGLDFDRRIQDYVIDNFQRTHGINLRDKPISMLKMAPVVEEAKKDLTDLDVTNISIEDGALDIDGVGGFIDVNTELTRMDFEAMVADLVSRTMTITKQVMDDAGIGPEQVDEVILVGGMTRVPAIRNAVASYFGAAKLRDTISVDTAIARGAAIYAAEKDGRRTQRFSHTQITSMAFGIASEGDKFIQVIPEGAPFGTLETITVTTSTDGQTQIPIAIAEGQSKRASENALLTLYTHNVLPRAATVPTIEVEWLVDDNGQLIVVGKDMDTGEQFEIKGAP